MSALPTGTVTLLLADVEGSTRLWETRPAEMAAALKLLNDSVCEIVSAHDGARPLEQGEGDSFVAAFSRATDALGCAHDIQRTCPEPIRLRIGLHTGEVELRDDDNYAGPVINRAARLRDLAHGGQIVLSTATEAMVADHLPAGMWLTELGTHRLRDLLRPERVLQLCHPDLPTTFPPLRTAATSHVHNFPMQLTRFVGRQRQVADVRESLTTERLVTFTGAGGIGKTRLAQQLCAEPNEHFPGGAWFVDLAPIDVPDVVPIAVARALGLPDQPGRTTLETLTHSIGEQHTLMILDNCEHVVDTVASLLTSLLGACPHLKVLATSRESLAVAGEVTWRVPPLSLETEAVDLFIDRARRVRPQLAVTAEALATIAEICRRLDGMPLAIERAAARTRSLSLKEIAEGLHDRFRLLTGGARTAVRRHQTMRASVDWSYELLTGPEKVMFQRLGVFVGGCDLTAAEEVAAADDVDRCQVLDLLTTLVDKSLVYVDDNAGTARYRMLEALRQFASERLNEHGDADRVRKRHRDYYASLAALIGAPSADVRVQRLRDAALEMDNLHAAFLWSHESNDFDLALQLASSLQAVWLETGRILEGIAWFDAVLANIGDAALTPAVHAHALADRAILASHLAAVDAFSQAQQALALARDVGDEPLLTRALTACGSIAAFEPDLALPFLDEAESLARSSGDMWCLGQVLAFKSYAAVSGAGDPTAAIRYGTEGRDVSDTVGDTSSSRWSRWSIGDALYMKGDCMEAIGRLRQLIDEAHAAQDVQARVVAEIVLVYPLSYLGKTAQARATAAAAVESSTTLSLPLEGLAYAAKAVAALAAGDFASAASASSAALERLGDNAAFAALNVNPAAVVALIAGKYAEARVMTDKAVSVRRGWHLACALGDGARVALAQGEVERARSDAGKALAEIVRVQAYQPLPDILEILATISVANGNHDVGIRLFGAAQSMRDRTQLVRLPFFDHDHARAVATARTALGQEDFDRAWAEGTALSTDDAIAYALRGRGERRRPATGWEALTPTERDIARHVSTGLANKDIATRMFISVRTVQTHLTHIYAKVGVTSRVQLAQEASRRLMN